MDDPGREIDEALSDIESAVERARHRINAAGASLVADVEMADSEQEASERALSDLRCAVEQALAELDDRDIRAAVATLSAALEPADES